MQSECLPLLWVHKQVSKVDQKNHHFSLRKLLNPGVPGPEDVGPLSERVRGDVESRVSYQRLLPQL